MKRFIVVIHGWHVHSNGFTLHEVEAASVQEAEEKGAYLKDQREKPFDRCAYAVVEIESGERIARDLTWRERLTGKVTACTHSAN